jgi:acyl carrier protein
VNTDNESLGGWELMQEAEIRQTLCEIFNIVLDLPEGSDLARIRRLNTRAWDSLAHVSLVSAIESEFRLVLDAADRERLTSYPAAELLLMEKFV